MLTTNKKSESVSEVSFRSDHVHEFKYYLYLIRSLYLFFFEINIPSQPLLTYLISASSCRKFVDVDIIALQPAL